MELNIKVNVFQENYETMKEELENHYNTFKQTFFDSLPNKKDIESLGNKPDIFIRDMFLKQVSMQFSIKVSELLSKLTKNELVNFDIIIGEIFSSTFHVLELLKPTFDSVDLSLKNDLTKIIDDKIKEWFSLFKENTCEEITEIVKFQYDEQEIEDKEGNKQKIKKTPQEVMQQTITSFLFFQPTFVNFHKALMNLHIYTLMDKSKFVDLNTKKLTDIGKKNHGDVQELVGKQTKDLFEVTTFELLQFLYNVLIFYEIIKKGDKKLKDNKIVSISDRVGKR